MRTHRRQEAETDGRVNPAERSILVVEDSRDLEDLITIVLELGGYRARLCGASWTTAAAALDRAPLGLIVADEAIPPEGDRPAEATVVALTRWGEGRPKWADADLDMVEITKLPDLLDRLSELRIVRSERASETRA